MDGTVDLTPPAVHAEPSETRRQQAAGCPAHLCPREAVCAGAAQARAETRTQGAPEGRPGTRCAMGNKSDFFEGKML